MNKIVVLKNISEIFEIQFSGIQRIRTENGHSKKSWKTMNIKMYKLWYKIFGDNLCYDSKWYQNELTFLAKNPPKTFQFSIGCKKFKELWNVLGDLQTLWTYEQNTWRLWHLL